MLIEFYEKRIPFLQRNLNPESPIYEHYGRRLDRWETIIEMLKGERDHCEEAQEFFRVMELMIDNPDIYRMELEAGRHMHFCQDCDYSSLSYELNNSEVMVRAENYLKRHGVI